MIFRKKNTDFTSLSPSQKTWKRFKRNKPAVAGMWIIVLACLISILGYLITPDKSPFANNQKPELHIKDPGFKIKFLFVTRNAEVEKSNLFSRMIAGQEDRHAAYTAYSHRFQGPNIIIEEYTGNTPNKGEESGFNLADVIYSLDTRKKIEFDSALNVLTFYELGNSNATKKSVSELQKTVEKNNIRSKQYLLGTDLLGRDLLSRLMIGTRISLTVGIISVLISIFIGILLGSLAGYFRGTIDAVISWFINVVWAIPTILLVIAITLVLGKGIMQVFIAVGLTMWVDVARVVRGQILSIREKEFVEAGRALGYQNSRIIFKHILPNVMGPVIVMAASNFASAILMEAGLSFLGLGAQPPMPSWGEMINAHRGYILMDKAYLAFIPGIAIMTLVLAFMMVGNGLRDAMDTKMADSKPI